MVEYTSPKASKSSGLPTSYIAVWGLLACIALGYLALLAIRPDLAAGFSLRPLDGAPENNWNQRSMSKVLAELSTARSAIGKLQEDVQDVRAVLAAQEQRSLIIAARVGAVEAQQKSSQLPVSHAVPVAERTEPGKATVNALAGVATEGTIEERPTRMLREGQSSASAPAPAQALAPALPPALATASATGAPIAKQTEPARPPHGLLLASGPSLDAVRLSWQLLNENNRSALKKYEPRFIETSTGGGLFQLIAGPAGTPEEAARVCERLKAKQVRCSVTTFKGQPL